jgi:hypothetical protein
VRFQLLGDESGKEGVFVSLRRKLGRGPVKRLTERYLRKAQQDTSTPTDQIKGRNFEVPGCGGFLLTGLAADLGTYYAIENEVSCFTSMKDLIEKVHYYVRHEDQRSRIASAGYQRTLREHTYVHRYSHIFHSCGLPSPHPDAVLAGKVPPGHTEEIG